jgi:hypothetical protein
LKVLIMGMLKSIINYKPIEKNVGKGNPGPKTLALRADRAAMEQTRLHYPSHASFTPVFFQRFLQESGALMADGHRAAKRRIMKTEFSPEERGQIKEAILEFDPLLRLHLMVRSDDYAGGIGLGFSGGASISYERSGGFENIDPLIAQVELQMKKVLAGDFDPDMEAFKEKKGISGNPGVLLMPVFGEYMPFPDEKAPRAGIAPLLSVNFLGKVKGKALVAVGVGIGGANSRFAMHELDYCVPDDKYEEEAVTYRGKAISRDDGTIIEASFKEYIQSRARARSLYPDQWDILDSEIDRLLSQTGPRYLEIVQEDVIRPSWVVVQSAPFEIKNVERPEIMNGAVLETDKVIGTKLLNTEKIRFAGRRPTSEDVAYNQREDGYALLIDSPAMADMGNNWSLRHYSNAGAIVVALDEIFGMLSSHLNGYFRELDIPVLAVQGSRLRMVVERAGDENLGCTIYANEFSSEGFVALGPIRMPNL